MKGFISFLVMYALALGLSGCTNNVNDIKVVNEQTLSAIKSEEEIPNFKGLKGYVTTNWDFINSTRDGYRATPWNVRIYGGAYDTDEDGIYGFKKHKAEVEVLDQFLYIDTIGKCNGNLLVKELETGEEYYLNIGNFKTEAYWDYDVAKAATVGECIATYSNVSGMKPFTSSGREINIEKGAEVLVAGTPYTDNGENIVRCLVFRRRSHNATPFEVYINTEDLTVIY